MKRIRAHITFANVMASAAVFIALGGTSYATVVTLRDNSVRSRHIADGEVQRQDLDWNSVDSTRVRDGALLKRDFAGPLDADKLGGMTPQAFQRRGKNTACPAGQKVTGLGASGDVTCAADGGGGGGNGAEVLGKRLEVTATPGGNSGGQDFVQVPGRFRITLTCLNGDAGGTGAQPDLENLSDGPIELWLDPSSGSPLYGSVEPGASASETFGEPFVDEEPQTMIYQGYDEGKLFTAIVTTSQLEPGTCHGSARILLGP